jgi:hypothetical protein
VSIDATVATALPQDSIFPDLKTASDFFAAGAVGYSPSRSNRLDGLALHTNSWKVEPLSVEKVESTFFDNPNTFPKGSIHFDCALVMRNIPHEWHTQQPICTDCTPVSV